MTVGCVETRSDTPETRIVSLNPCTDAILAEIAPDKLAAVSRYSHDPAASSMDVATARRWPATAGTVEEVAALEPDLVVASTFLPPASGQAFERLELPVIRMGMARTVADSIAQIRNLAAQVGEVEAGEALIARIEAALDDAAGEGAPISALVWQSGGIVPGSKTLIADLLRRTGFANAAATRGLGQADRLPLEAVLADPPALILVAGSPFAESDRALYHPALDEVEVPQAALPSNLLYCGGPTIIRAVKRLHEIRTNLPSRLREGPGVGEVAHGISAHPAATRLSFASPSLAAPPASGRGVR